MRQIYNLYDQISWQTLLLISEVSPPSSMECIENSTQYLRRQLETLTLHSRPVSISELTLSKGQWAVSSHWTISILLKVKDSGKQKYWLLLEIFPTPKAMLFISETLYYQAIWIKPRSLNPKGQFYSQKTPQKITDSKT